MPNKSEGGFKAQERVPGRTFSTKWTAATPCGHQQCSINFYLFQPSNPKSVPNDPRYCDWVGIQDSNCQIKRNTNQVNLITQVVM